MDGSRRTIREQIQNINKDKLPKEIKQILGLQSVIAEMKASVEGFTSVFERIEELVKRKTGQLKSSSLWNGRRENGP